MKLLKKPVSILLVMTMIVSIFTIIPSVRKAEAALPSELTTYPGFDNLDARWDCNWMSYLPDSTKLNELSIPGIHDACAVDMNYSTWLSHFAQTQDYFINGQLVNGVRYFDLRIGKDDGKLTMCHNSVLLNGKDGERLRLKTVINDMLDFLSTHDGETLILQIKCDKDKCDQEIYEYFKNLLAEQPDKIYCGDHTPTLGEARGKLVILSRLKLTKYEDDLHKEAPYQPNYLLEDGTYWALDVSRFEGGDETNKTMAKTTDFGTVEVWTEDVYNIEPSGKWDYVKGSLTGDLSAAYRKNDARSRDKDAWSIIYTSLSYQDSDALISSFVTAIALGLAAGGIFGALLSADITYLIEDNNDMVWPDDGADEINPKLNDLLKNNPDLYTGCLQTDFMDENLSRRIYSTNFVRRNQDPWNQTHRVTFDSNGGSSVEPQDVLPGGYASEPETPVREGYNFSGWYTTREADRKDFWYFDYDPVYRDMTLYAKWDESSVPYVDANGNSMPAEEAEGIFDESLMGTFTLTETGSTGGWYAAQKNFGGEKTGLVIDGNVNLILCDGVKLRLYEGIKVPAGSSLTIWAQSTDASTRGSLLAIKSESDAAIGTSLTEACGSVTFNGGSIIAEGRAGAAAIGGLDADTTINGGSVFAHSCKTDDIYLPAIGGAGGSVTITDGVVTAYSYEYAPAIGSVGDKSTKVEISGGKVKAFGEYISSPAIGAGSIAADQSVAKADVTISGGIVTATAIHYAGENSGWVIGGQSGTVRIAGGTVTADSSGSSAPCTGIGGENCTVDLSWTSADDSVTSCSYDGNIVLHEDKPFRFDDGSGVVSAQDILTSQNKTIVPKAAVGMLTKTEALAPTCVSSGYKAYWTDEEGSLFADEEGTKRIEEPEVIPALGHDWGDSVYAWEDDCDDPDIETHHYMCTAIRTCKRDDAHTQARHVIASETIEAEANCTLPGTKVLTAVFNTDWAEDQTKQIEIPATGHDWGEWTVTKEATPTEEGEETRVCKNAPSHTETRAIPKVDENATFTITFSDEDGATLQTSDVKYGEAPVFSATLPEKDGYTFDGWTDGENTYANGELPVVKKAASYTAVFSRYVPLVEPTIDENGAYILGHVAYYEMGGRQYAVNDEGSVGEELDSVILSYFDFKLINNDTAYQINYYTGPTANLEALVIPKTFNGKPITVLGNDDITETNNSKLFKTGNANLHPFTLELNENITEIKPYTFWAIWVTKVTGNTSNLDTIGKYAFSWANSSGGYALDIRLDHEGTIKCGAGIFNNMNVTARIKHATRFDRSSFSQKSLTYVFTDAHPYGDPVWTWADDYSTVSAVFTCTDSRCKHEEIVNATVTNETKDGIITYTATAQLDGKTCTDTKTAYSDGVGARLLGHSISLDGDIAVNFYMELDDSIKNSDTAYMQFTIPNTSAEYQDQKVYVKDLTPVEGGYYIFKCRVAAKDMTSTITAQILGTDKESAVYTYSVKDYADYLLEHKNDSAAYTKAAPLVEKMLQYGAYAKEYFDNTDTLDALDEVYVDEKFSTYTSTLVEDIFSGATLSLKSQTTLSLYFTNVDDLTFTCEDKNKTERVVDTAKNGGYQVARIRNIAAKELQDDFTLTVKSGETVLGTITYSPMNYCYNAMFKSTDAKLINAVKALVQYSQEANEYFK